MKTQTEILAIIYDLSRSPGNKCGKSLAGSACASIDILTGYMLAMTDLKQRILEKA
jgi:hypothetical protein